MTTQFGHPQAEPVSACVVGALAGRLPDGCSIELLERYVAEHPWWFNRRGRHMADRMGAAAAGMDGRSLTYRQITSLRGSHDVEQVERVVL